MTFATGQRVRRSTGNANRLGTVAYERGGFVKVRWDHGDPSVEWGGELVLV